MTRLNRVVWVAILTGGIVFGATPANAEGWLSNPFSKKKTASKTTSAGYRSADSNSKSWLPKMKMPKLPGFGGSKQANKPSITQKATAGAKNMYAKTKALVTKPFSSKKKPPAAQRSQFSLGYGSNKGAAKKKKKSYFSWLLPYGEKKPREVRSVNDFLSQERPEF